MATKLNPEAVIDASITKQKLSSQLQSELTDASEHISDSTIHITAAERTGWNGKADQNGNYPNLHVGVADNLLDKGDIQRDEEIMFRPTAGELSVSNGQTTIEKIKGKTIVWNQRLGSGVSTYGEVWEENKGIFTLRNKTFAESKIDYDTTGTFKPIPVGHIALYHVKVEGEFSGNITVSVRYINNLRLSFDEPGDKWAIGTPYEEGYIFFRTYTEGLSITNIKVTQNAFDLTQMFGAGNEPSTIAEFEKLFPKSYYDYNPGQLISFNGEEIKTTGFNQWDEEWEVGSINDTTGQNEVYSNWWRCKNYIKCIPGITYHYTDYGGSLTDFRLYFYDADKKFINYQSTSRFFDSNGNFIIPQNAYYFRFRFAQEHHSDDVICFNLHHTGIRDGQYEPYIEHTKTLPDLSNFDVTYTGADGQTHIAGGLKSAGSVYDEQTGTKDIRRIGVVDLGSLEWIAMSITGLFYAPLSYKSNNNNGLCTSYIQVNNKNIALADLPDLTFKPHSSTSNTIYIRNDSYTDAASLKASLAGVLLYYELDTPVETSVQSRNMYYSVDDYGTEQLLPENTSVPTTTPMIADIKYRFNAVDLVRTIPSLTDRVEELEEDVVYKGEVVDSDVIDIDATLPARMGNAENDISSIKTRLSNIETEIIFGKHKYCVGYWLENASTATDAELNNPDALGVIGNKDWVLDWRPFLVDMTPKEGEIYKRPIAELKKNNWLRDITGEWAPVIGITQAQWDECMGNDLYFEGNVLYCNSGQYNPTDFWENHCSIQVISGVKTLTHDKLYKSSGTEVSHYLMPYETAEKKYSIFIGKADGEELYLLDEVVGESGREWKGVLGHGIDTWDGIDASRYKLEATGICPSPVTAIKEGSQIKLRSFYYDYPNTDISQANGAVSTLLPSLTLFSGGHFPMVSIGQQTVMGYAWANNYDTNKPYPCAEGGYHARNTFLTCMESGYGTKNLNTATRFSSGVSARDTCNSEATWKANGGVRFRVKTGTNWTYGTWGTTPNLYYDKNGVLTKVSNWSDTFNSYRLKCKSLEAQLAVSFATELGISAGEEFDFRGNTWYYQGISELGVTGLSGGQMNCRVYKKLSQDFTALDSTGASGEYEIEVILRTGLMQGCDMSGDGGPYWGGGAEMIGLCSNITQGSDGNIADCYLQPDQKKWVKDSTITKSDGGRFTCEDTYLYLGQAAGGQYNYIRRRVPYSPAPLLYGGSLTSGECAYTYDRNYWGSTLGARVRQGLRFGSASNYSSLSSRLLASNYAASATTQFYCGSAQILLDVQRRAAQ